MSNAQRKCGGKSGGKREHRLAAQSSAAQRRRGGEGLDVRAERRGERGEESQRDVERLAHSGSERLEDRKSVASGATGVSVGVGVEVGVGVATVLRGGL